MPLDNQTQKVIQELGTLRDGPIETLSPGEARRQPSPADAAAAVAARDGGPAPREEVSDVRELRVPGPGGELRLCVYLPKRTLRQRAKAAIGALDEHDPVLAWFHGGGLGLADLDSDDALPRGLANRTQAIVVAVDHRAAPEHPFPAAHEDALAAVRWLMSHATEFGGDPERVAVGGEGVGATLATATCISLCENEEPLPVFQLLVSPLTDLSTDEWESYSENAAAEPLGTAVVDWFRRHAVPDGVPVADVRLSPNQAPREILRGLPPAMVVVAELDPLRDQGRAYAERLRLAGVPTQLADYPGVPHAFVEMLAVSETARAAADDAAEALSHHFKMAVPSGR